MMAMVGLLKIKIGVSVHMDERKGEVMEAGYTISLNPPSLLPRSPPLAC